MLYIVCALRCEALPLIESLNLKASLESLPFLLFEGENLKLIISGVGKVASGAAASFLFSRTPKKATPAWLNIGVAGHLEEEIGKGFLAKKITDKGTKKTYYPGISLMPPIACQEIITVDFPSTTYAKNALVEMEASGFYATALRVSPCELIHCYKVISDNALQTGGKICKNFVKNLIANKLEDISKIKERLLGLTAELNQRASSENLAAFFCDKWHFTATQKVLLKELLRRWNALLNGEGGACTASILPKQEKLANAEQFLKYLEEKINSHPLRICSKSFQKSR